jgi:hypothetical protein
MAKMLRFIDTEFDPNLSPINNYSTLQCLSLEQALEPIVSRLPELDQCIQTAKTKCHFPSKHGLTLDESAAIFLYTMEWNDSSLYQVIKSDLRCKDQSISESWFAYLKLFNTLVQKLPNSRMNVWRGVNKNMSNKLTKVDKIIWWNIISCSSSDNIIKDCLGQNSSLCFIEAVNGKDISIYSNSPNQNEIILCPGTRLRVVNNVQEQTSSQVLHLTEDSGQLPSFFMTNSVVKIILSRCRNSRVLSLMPYFIVLMIALLLVTVIGKSLTIFESSYISTVKEPSNSRIHVDTLKNRYEGGWKDEKKHGKGKMDFANGYKYSGDWIDDMATGEGIFTWPNGDQYEGQFKNGQRHGKGSYSFANGDKYIGDWFEDKKSGKGISTLTLGKYEGQFQDDKMHGKGSFHFADGNRYIGHWVDDKQEGEGIVRWTNGDRFEMTSS